MSLNSLDGSSFSPTELKRLHQWLDDGSAEIDRLFHNEIEICHQILLGSADVRSLGMQGVAASISACSRFVSPRYVGSGAFGIVFIVFDKTLGMDVAIKMLRPSRSSPMVQQRFLEEAKITASLTHPGIVRLFDSGTIQNLPYITSEIVSGGSLSDRIGKHPEGMPIRDACTILVHVAEAVAYAHSKLTYHRDIKPGNILLHPLGETCQELRPVLTDFGLAKRWNQKDGALTTDGDVIGTARYMSPEQASGTLAEYSVTSEVFSLGIVLYEMLTGRLPFDGETTVEIRRRIIDGRLVSAKHRRPKIPSDLNAIVLKCLAHSPEHRYESVSLLVKDLRRFLHGEPVEASRPKFFRQLMWNAKKHPWVTSSVLGTALSLIVSTASISYAWWQQSAIAKREFQTKLSYMVLFGDLIDDVVSGQKDQEVVIVDSLKEFRTNLERDLQSNPTDEELSHMLSVVLHYQAMTYTRLGDLEEAARCRIESASILQTLSRRAPGNSKYRFQYVFGLSYACEPRPANEPVRMNQFTELLSKKLDIDNERERIETLLGEIDRLVNDFPDQHDYINACNQFRLDAAFWIAGERPERSEAITSEVIRDSLAIASEHRENPIYIKPLIHAYMQLADRSLEKGDPTRSLEHTDSALKYFEEYLRAHFERQWVRTEFLYIKFRQCNYLFRAKDYPRAIVESAEAAELNQEFLSMSALRIHTNLQRFRFLAIQYLSKLELGDPSAEQLLAPLTSAAESCRTIETARKDCLDWSIAHGLPSAVVAVLEIQVDDAS
jgi:serine/threonine protein kinase